MPDLPYEKERRSRAVPIAMTLFAVVLVSLGMFDPHGRTHSQPNAMPLEQVQLMRGDARAGFPRLPVPDDPPRGPGS